MSIRIKMEARELVSLMAEIGAANASHIEAEGRANSRADRAICDVADTKAEARSLKYEVTGLREQLEYANRDYRNSTNKIDELEKLVTSLKAENAALRLSAGIPLPVLPRNFTMALYMQVVALLQSGSKISAIKIVRETTGLGLKESKDLVEDGKTFYPQEWEPLQEKDIPKPSAEPLPNDGIKGSVLGTPQPGEEIVAPLPPPPKVPDIGGRPGTGRGIYID